MGAAICQRQDMMDFLRGSGPAFLHAYLAQRVDMRSMMDRVFSTTVEVLTFPSSRYSKVGSSTPSSSGAKRFRPGPLASG